MWSYSTLIVRVVLSSGDLCCQEVPFNSNQFQSIPFSFSWFLTQVLKASMSCDMAVCCISTGPQQSVYLLMLKHYGYSYSLESLDYSH